MSRIIVFVSTILLSALLFLADAMHVEGVIRGLFGFLFGILIGTFAFYITKDM